MSADVRGRVPTGAIRYNSDSNKMECFNGTKWMQVAVSSPDLDGGARGIIFTGSSGSNSIDFITIPIAGNATDFGNRTQNCEPSQNACGSKTRAFFGGGEGNTDRIEFVTFSTTGDATDFGNLTVSRGAGPVSYTHLRAHET